jgi:hypothetical protein
MIATTSCYSLQYHDPLLCSLKLIDNWLCLSSTKEIRARASFFVCGELHSSHHPHHFCKSGWSSIFNAHHAVSFCAYKVQIWQFFAFDLHMQTLAVIFFESKTIAHAAFFYHVIWSGSSYSPLPGCQIEVYSLEICCFTFAN